MTNPTGRVDAGAVTDPFDLERFVQAQNSADVYARAVAEIGAGRKQSHWMWFVFPQVAGLGSSPMAVRYAIGSVAEARSYLSHEVLGVRLVECTRLVAESAASSAEELFGAVDAKKLRSSMTLFDGAAPTEALFSTVIDRLFDGHRDEATQRLLQ